MGYKTRIDDLEEELKIKIDELIDVYGTESQFTSETKCYDCRYNEDLQFNLNCPAYLLELHENGIWSNDGQVYHYDTIATRDLCFIVDTIIEDHKDDKNE